MIKIIPAIIAKNTSDLLSKLSLVEKFPACRIAQIDIMDGVFVKNKTISSRSILNLKIRAPYELHLMIQYTEKKLTGFLKTSARRITVHYESAKDLNDIINKVHESHKEFYLALNPQTPISVIRPYIHKIDSVLLLSVEPGFYGSSFQTITYQRVKKVHSLAPRLPISVDGGISLDNISRLIQSGATQFVIGSKIFRASDPKIAYNKFRKVK